MAKPLRPFAILVTVGWLALCALLLVLLWFPSRIVSIDLTDLALTVDADAFGTARIVATVVTAIAALLAAPLLIAALRSSPRRAAQGDPARPAQVIERVEPTQITERVEPAPRVHADLASERQAAVATTPVIAGDDMDSMRRRVDQHESELRRLREQLDDARRQPAPPDGHDARQHVPNGTRP